ncbi:MAG: trigger factor [Clostridia bacterium]|nr:trigger factor [Peptococcus niger]MDU7245434.1 trigger factor [Clostridiales bacterium]MDU7504689.1 trigger factor [Clostridia bacterium]
MNVEIKALDKVRKELTIEVDQDVFDKAVQDAYKDQKGKIAIPGFRKGKAPKALIEQHYGKDFFYYDAAEKCVYPAYLEAIKDNEDIKPVGDPSFDVEQLEVGKPFIFKVVVDTKQEVALGEYKGIELEKLDTEVTDEMVDAELKRAQERTALLEDAPEDAVVEKNDSVTLDFEGKKDGVPFDGGTAENYELVIGSNSFIPGFEDGMLGMKVGESKDIPLTFPEDYHAEDLAGQEVVFTVKVNDIKRKVLADLDDEFAKDVSEFDTLDDYKADIRKDLTKQVEESTQAQYKNKVTEKVVADSDVVAPQSLVEKETDNYINEMAYSMRNQGIELEQYLQLTGGNMDGLRDEFKKRAEESVKASIVLEAIAEAENITVADEEVEAEFDRLAEAYDMKKEDIKRAFVMQGQGDSIARNMVLEKTVDFLLDNANIG